jgi:hypothetical protein
MVTSTPEDAPRGMKFLHSLNRLNVAVSRARAGSALLLDGFIFLLNLRRAPDFDRTRSAKMEQFEEKNFYNMLKPLLLLDS